MVKLTHDRRGLRRQEPTLARVCAFRVLQRTFGEDAYADRVFRAEADRVGLDARDRAFAQRLAYGAIQNRATLDYVVAGLSARPAETIELPLLNALRLGVYQVALLDGVPDHAAVDQTVELAKYRGHARASARERGHAPRDARGERPDRRSSATTARRRRPFATRTPSGSSACGGTRSGRRRRSRSWSATTRRPRARSGRTS